MHSTPYRISTLAPGSFDLTTISGVRDFVRTRIKDERQRLVANVAILLGQTSAEQIVKLNGRDAVRRIKAVYGERVAELIETRLVKRNKTLDAPVAANLAGGAASRTTLWRALRQLGLVTMRYLAKAVVTKLVKPQPANREITQKLKPQAECFTPAQIVPAIPAPVPQRPAPVLWRDDPRNRFRGVDLLAKLFPEKKPEKKPENKPKFGAYGEASGEDAWYGPEDDGNYDNGGT